MEDVEVDVFLVFGLLVASHFGDGRNGIPCNACLIETGGRMVDDLTGSTGKTRRPRMLEPI